MKLLTEEEGALLQSCIQGVELAFLKWEEKEGRAFGKLTALKQHERRSSSVLLQPEFVSSP